MIDDVDIQAALAALVVGFHPSLHLVLTARHHHEARIGTGDDAVEVGHLDVGFERDPVFARNVAVRSVGQRFCQLVLLLELLCFGLLADDVLQGFGVGGIAVAHRVAAAVEIEFLSRQLVFFGSQLFLVELFCLTKLGFKLRFLAVQLLQNLLLIAVLSLRGFQVFL